MQLYLPIADIPVNVFLILAMGAAVGFVSGMFGIGGGFLMTPLLIFVGIAPAVAVASVASHIAASSFSGALSYWRKRDDVAKRLDAQSLAAAKLAIQTFTPEGQPDDAVNVASPAGGWDVAPTQASSAKPAPAAKPALTKRAAR